MIKNSAKACTYTPAVIGFPAHCAKSDGRICGKYRNRNGTDISAPSPGYAPLTDTRCNQIECHIDDHCGSEGEKYCHMGQCVVCSSPEHCDSDEICENNVCVKSIKCTSSSPYCNFLQELPDGCESDASKCSVKDLDECCTYNIGYLAVAIVIMVFIFFVGCIYYEVKVKGRRGVTVFAALVIDGIIAAYVFGGFHWLGSSIESEWDSLVN